MEMNIAKMILYSITCINNKYFLLFMIAVSLLYSACNSPVSSTKPDYGAAYNHVRDSLGLKPLSPDWTVSKYDKYHKNIIYPIDAVVLMYDNPEIDSTLNEFKVYYTGKTLIIENDTLKHESDNYGIIRFPTPTKGVVKEALSYRYSYYSDYIIPPRMTYEYLINPHPELDSMSRFAEWIDGHIRHDSLGRSLPMTRAEADSILATWGMKYP